MSNNQKEAVRRANKERAERQAQSIIGKRFNHLTIKEVRSPMVVCQCDCGKEKTAYRSSVLSGKTSSCGCKRAQRLRESRQDWKDRTGEQYNNLTIVSVLDGYRCQAECSCGSIKEYYIGNLTSDQIKSCGCKTSEMRHATNMEKYGSKSVSCTISKGEVELAEWIESLGLKTEKKIIHTGDSKFIELDIVIEEKKIAIEYNGARWHQESKERDRNYHFNKTEVANKAGYRLIHIFDFEWLNKKDRVKSFLRSALSKNSRKVPARKCELRTIESKTSREFLDKYHILGFTPGLHYVGYYFEDELLGVAVFGKHHITNSGLVLSRWCVKEDVSIQGGLSRLMSNLPKIVDIKVDKIISWADIRISNGNGYLSSGWKLEGVTGPDYFYFDPKNKEVIYKYRRRKTVMGTPSEMTEYEHAKADGLYKIWDCGKMRMTWEY